MLANCLVVEEVLVGLEAEVVGRLAFAVALLSADELVGILTQVG